MNQGFGPEIAISLANSQSINGSRDHIGQLRPIGPTLTQRDSVQKLGGSLVNVDDQRTEGRRMLNI